MAFNTRLFVGNLPDNFNEKALRDAFSSYGDITNFDLKNKPGIESDKKTFAFVTIAASNFNVESCIKYFANEDFQGNRLYVTRARESFLERLQREREQTQNCDNKQICDFLQIEQTQNNSIPENIPIIQKSKVNKRKFIDDELDDDNIGKKSKVKSLENYNNTTPFNNDDDIKKNKFPSPNINQKNKKDSNLFQYDEKKQNSDKKRLESMKKKRQEFNEKKNIIKTGLISIDKKPNKKVIFSETEEDYSTQNNVMSNGDNTTQAINRKTSLFEDEASDDEINFEIKKQFEGKKGQKVLDLQSRYKSDKRFVLDKRFVEEDSASEKEDNGENQEEVEVGQADEKSKQLDILQDVLGVTIKTKQYESTSKTKTKLGMLRFDPMQPEHAKYLAPVETKQESAKKSKKKKAKDVEAKEEEASQQPETEVEKVEVSKEQFYKISDTLKEAISQPNSFSLRSLFTKDDGVQEEAPKEDTNYIPLQSKKVSKVKNPLEPGEKNPFVYDSSESENEEEDTNKQLNGVVEEKVETKIIWREKLFFTPADNRLRDGLLFFTKVNENSGQKERRELKSLMKKRMYNKERKNTMFQKKIGGRKKTMKKKFKNKKG